VTKTVSMRQKSPLFRQSAARRGARSPQVPDNAGFYFLSSAVKLA
jgi:hypothetical protein